MDSTCYNGGDIAGAIIGSLLGGALLACLAYWLYKKFWNIKKDNNHLVPEDPENVQAEFAFDNPAFKGEKTHSQIETKWTANKNDSLDKRKPADDSHTENQTPRIVSLRGSDFTGLGIEVCGGLKEGIFIKKVMPQGPAAAIVSVGDKITSITIDFQHIVQEDASTILSYASPYNVQLELFDGKRLFPTRANSQSPTMGQPASLTHPLYRSSSQDDFNTIERNARKKLFGNDGNNYPTLKMEQQQQQQQQQQHQQQHQRQSPVKTIPAIAHREHEKKSPAKQFRKLIEDTFSPGKTIESVQKESFERRSASPDIGGDVGTNKGLKFGIKVLPSSTLTNKSPNKIQTDNENNANQERTEQIETTIATIKQSPPPVMKRTKLKPDDVQTSNKTADLKRQGSITSSGIRRDAQGIPVEIPNEMMQAAMAAKDHRKSTAQINADAKKSKGKAPKPPPAIGGGGGALETDRSDDVEPMESTETTEIEQEPVPIDVVDSHQTTSEQIQLNSSNIKPHQIETYDRDSDNDTSNNSIQIELNSNLITVHQNSEEEESEHDSERRTASLGDLSKLGSLSTFSGGKRTKSGTLERAQSLEMTDTGTAPLSLSATTSTSAIPKKRKAPNSGTDIGIDPKEARLMNVNQFDSLQRRLKSANEWGMLEDAIYDSHRNTLIESDGKDREGHENYINNDDIIDDADDSAKNVEQIITLLDNSSSENYKIITFEQGVMQTINKEPYASGTSVIVVQDHPKINGMSEKVSEKLSNEVAEKVSEKMSEKFDSKWNSTVSNDIKSKLEEPKSVSTIINETISKVDATDGNSLTMPQHQYKFSEKISETIDINPSNYGTNIPDDVKVTRFSFGSLERPKSDVLKKLISQQIEDSTNYSSTSITAISSPSTILSTIDTSMDDSEIHEQHHYDDRQQLPIISSRSSSSSITTTTTTISPVFSSDHQGISSINISTVKSSTIADIKTNSEELIRENLVMMTGDRSQPSSIIMIDDDKLDFTLRTLDNEFINIGPSAKLAEPKDEVIIIESLSSKKIPESHPQIPVEFKRDDLKTFVTEICVKTSNDMHDSDNQNDTDNDNDDNESNEINTIHMARPNTFNNSNIINNNNNNNNDSNTTNNNSNVDNNSAKNQSNEENRSNKDEYIPKNSEIKFTTSTYESPSSNRHIIIDKEKRLSHIDQIRSNFERNNLSDIPVPMRKNSIPTTPTTRTSPSKIPVPNSIKVNEITTKIFSNNNNNSSSNGNNGANNNGNESGNGNNVNRVSVSVTTIKNSSKHPSGGTQ